MSNPKKNTTGQNRDPVVYLGFVAVLLAQYDYLGITTAGIMALAYAVYSAAIILTDSYKSVSRWLA